MLEELGVRMDKYTSIVRTAAGEDRSIIGRVHVPVEFKGVEKVLTFYVCPYLEQELYLGIDFWRKFALAPAILGEIPATKPKANVSANTCIRPTSGAAGNTTSAPVSST
ncbi:uncharacterized protein LOC120457615 [Drosophila santomea]|uniref:uncharacterized protein LOC120457615 n=1 Tax=Drosophila santomea TaxID=129105 RepID=UPI001953FD4F|nr:uncharacterized protein LOC120457615 [Drosophila santomea]